MRAFEIGSSMMVAGANSTKSKRQFSTGKKGATIISGKVQGVVGGGENPIFTHAIFRPFF